MGYIVQQSMHTHTEKNNQEKKLLKPSQQLVPYIHKIYTQCSNTPSPQHTTHI